MALSCSRGDLNWKFEKFLCRKDFQALQQEVLESPSGGITICGSIQKVCGCGTCAYGLMMNTAVLG